MKRNQTASEELVLSGYFKAHNIYGLGPLGALNRAAVDIYTRSLDKSRRWI